MSDYFFTVVCYEDDVVVGWYADLADAQEAAERQAALHGDTYMVYELRTAVRRAKQDLLEEEDE